MSFEHLTEYQREVLHLLRRIVRSLHHAFPQPPEFSITLTLYPVGGSMSSPVLPITSIPLGGQAQLVAQLTQNGAAYVPPAGSTFTFTPTVNSTDANVSSAPAIQDVTGGAVPLGQQFLLTDASGDAVGAVDAVTVSGTAPDGTTVTDTINITVGPATVVTSPFGLSLALFPAPVAAAAALKK
jgi:hypothetical protein